MPEAPPTIRPRPRREDVQIRHKIKLGPPCRLSLQQLRVKPRCGFLHHAAPLLSLVSGTFFFGGGTREDFLPSSSSSSPPKSKPNCSPCFSWYSSLSCSTWAQSSPSSWATICRLFQ